MKSRVLPLLLLLLGLMPAPLAALTPADEADMIRGMAYLRTNYNDPEGLPIVDAVMQRTNYSAEEWSEFYRRYFGTNTYTYALRFNWYWRHGHVNGWATPERALNQQLALYQVITNRLETLYAQHPNDLGQHLDRIGAAEREDLVAWNLQLWDISIWPAPGFDARLRSVDWLVGLRTRHSQWLDPNRYLGPSHQPYAAMFRAQYQLTILDALKRLGVTGSEIADQLSLTGRRRSILVNHGQHLLDNQFLNAEDLVGWEQLLEAMPSHFPKTPVLFWNTQLGNFGDRALPFTYDGIANGMNDGHAHDQRDHYWVTDDVPIATDAALGHAAGEAFYAWRPWMTANGQDERRDNLRSSAGTDARNYLHSRRVASEPDIYTRWLDGFFYDLNRVCFNNTEAAFTSASRRFLLEGRFQPLAQFLWWLDVWSGLGSTAQGFVLDERGTITRYDIPLTRDSSGRIRTFRMQGTTWQVGYFTSTRPNSLKALETTVPQVVSASATADQHSVTLTFSEAMTPSAVTNLASIRVNGSAPAVARLLPDLKTLVLTLGAPVSAPVVVTLSQFMDLGGNALPTPTTVNVVNSPWWTTDLGDPADPVVRGATAVLPTGEIAVNGGGSGLAQVRSRGHLAYQRLTGDFDVRVQLAAFSPMDSQESAGLMATASLEPDAPMFGITVIRPYRRSSFALFHRRAADQFPFDFERSYIHGVQDVDAAGTWLRLCREGQMVSAYRSADGQSWVRLGLSRLTGFPAELLVGLVASSGSNQSGRLSEARFRAFQVGTSDLPKVSLQVDRDGSLAEGVTDPRTVWLRLSRPLSIPLTVRLSYSGTAQLEKDYTAVGGSIVVPAGAQEVSFNLVPLVDAVPEGPESISLTVAADPAYEVASHPITFTLLDRQNPVGGLLREFYVDVGHYFLTNLTLHAKFPARPDFRDVVTSFESEQLDFNHGTRLRGYLMAPEAGDYRFFISSFDQAELYLSTDESPENRRLLAAEPQASDLRDWSVRYNGEKASGVVRLEAGRRYFIEVFHISGGLDGFSVTWQRPGEGQPVNGHPPIPGEFLSLRLEDLPPVLVQSPTNQLVLPGATASFAVVADGGGPLTYQWQFNGEDISDATNAVFEVTGVTGDFAGSYRVRVSNAAGTVTSPAAQLRVGPPLRWITEPNGVASLAGSTVAVGALADGTGTLTYQWFRNGAELAGQIQSTLLLTNVSSTDNGQYLVQVSDGWTVLRSAQVELRVVDPGEANAPAMQTHLRENFVSVSAGAAVWIPPSRAWSVRERLAGRSTPNGERTFLGSFGTEELTLTLSDLPPHTLARLAFDLAVLGTWDGDQGGPDIWGFRIQGGPGMAATFSNWEELGYTQSFPQSVGHGVFPAGTGARETDTLGNTYPGDTIYGFDWMFGHTNGSFSVTFFGRNLQALNDEAWGLQAVQVEFDAPPPVPQIATQPSDRFGDLGTTQLLLVTVEQPQPLQYLWRKDGAPLPGATNRTLSVTLSNASVIGGYDVVVANSSGSVTSRVAQVTMPVETVQFTTNALTVTELQGALSLPILRTGGSNDLHLSFVYSGNAVTNVDFQGGSASGFPTVWRGESSGSLSLRVLDDAVVDGPRTLTITLAATPYPNLVVGTNSTLTLTIEDNDTEAGPGFGFDGRIRSILSMADGGLLVGGDFLSANGVPRRTVARLRKDFSVDPAFVPDLPGWPLTFWLGQQPDGRVVVGWSASLRILEPDGRAMTGYLQRALQFNPGTLATFEVDGDGRVGLAGSLWTGTLLDRNRALMRLLADGAKDPEFSAISAVDPIPETGRALVVLRDGSIVVGGSFNNSGTSTNRGRIAKVRSDGTFDATFATGVGFNGTVSALAEDADGRLHVSGSFGLFGTNPVPGWVRLDSGGRLDNAFSPAATGSNITRLAVLPDGNLLALRATGLLEEYRTGGEAVRTLSTNATAFAIEATGFVVVGEGVPGAIRRIRPEGIPTTNRVGMAWGVRSVLESEERVRVAVRRTGPVDGAVEVRYQVTAQTAVPADGVSPANGVVRIGSGQTEAWIEIALTAQNRNVNDDRTFQVELLDPIGAQLDAGRSACVVTIVDDDRGLLSEIFSTQPYARVYPLATNPNTLVHPFRIFDQRLASRRDPTINFEWGSDGPRQGPADEFSVLWSGWLVPEVSGDYQLGTLSDDGSRIWLDGNLELRRWQFQSGTLSGSRSIPLVAGRPYRLVVHYFEGGTDAICRLLWRRVGAARYETIPSRVLRPDGFGMERPSLGVDWSPASQAFQVGCLTEPGRPTYIERSTNSVDWTFLYEANTESNGAPVLRLITEPAWSTQLLAGAVFRARTFDGLVSDVTEPAPLVARLQQTGLGLVDGSTNRVTLSVVGNGGAGQSFLWLKDGVEVGTGSTLLLASDQPGVEGSYRAMVTAPMGHATSAVHQVRYHRVPVVDQPLKDQTWVVGSTQSLSAGMSGVDLRFQWYKGGSPVSGQTQPHYQVGAVSLLSAGAYFVVGSNAAGSVTNGPVSIQVVQPIRFREWQVLQDGRLSLRVDGTSLSAWTLESSTDLIRWEVAEDRGLLPEGDGYVLPGSSAARERFFRVRLR